MERRNNFRKSVAFTLIMAMLMSSISFGGSMLGIGGENRAYAATEDQVNAAVTNTLTGYYGTQKNHILDDWEEMAAVMASGGDLEDYLLPTTPDAGSSAVITSLMKGDVTAAGIAAQKLVTEGALSTTYYAYGDAFNIIALEAYNKSVEETDEILYSTSSAIQTLLSYRTTVGGIGNQFFGLDYYTDAVYLDTDGAAMALVAFSLFSGDASLDKEKTIAIEQVKRAQTDSGTFSGAWGPNANTSAIAAWGIAAAGENLNSCYTSSASIKTPVDGLLSYYASGGGYGYDNSSTVDAYATKQASLAMADIHNGYSFYATLSSSAVNYISAEIQVITADGTYAEKKLTMGSDKTIAKAVQSALSTSTAIYYEDYNLYVNGDLETSPSERIISNGDVILAIADVYTKVAYFKTSATDGMGVNRVQAGFGESREMTLVEKNLADKTEVSLSLKPLDYGTAMATGYGTTNGEGKVTITPVESDIAYEIVAKRTAYDFNSGLTMTYIEDQTAILPAFITMSHGSPQTAVVNVRIEGPNSNIYYNEAVTVARPDGSRLTVFDAVTQALSAGSISYVHTNKYITAINGIASGSYGENNWDGWMYNIIEPDYLDGTLSLAGMGTQLISGGEEIVVYYGNDSMTTFYPIVSSKLSSNGSVEIEIKKYEKNWTTNLTSLVSASGVTVFWGYTSEGALTYMDVTNTDGKVTIPAEYSLTGQHSLQLSKGALNLPDVIRLAPNYSIGISAAGTSGGSGSTIDSEAAYLTVKGPYGNLKSRSAYVWYQGMTALHILQSSGLNIETDSSGNYVQSVEGVGEFDLGKNSGWLYSVNGVTPTNKASNSYEISANDNVIWYYTSDFTKDSSSSSWVAENETIAGTENTLTESTEVEARLDSNGNALASVSTSELATAVGKAIEALKGSDDDKQIEILIDVDMDSKANSLETKIPKAAIGNLITNKIDKLTISSLLGEMSFSLDTLKTIFADATGDVTINIEKVKEISGRPVLDLSVRSNGNRISKFSGVVTVTVPYTLAVGEKAFGIVVFYIGEEGKLINVKSSDYNEKTKMVTFKTDHFSEFMIGYKDATFKDIAGHWAQSSIEYLAARGIIKGKAEGLFLPNDSITRAEFITMLGNKAGADFSKYSTSSFGDVKGGEWFAGAVAWAAANGVVTGSEGLFKPNENISRQEMAVVLDRYMANIEKNSGVGTNKAILFADDSQIASYAKASVTKMQQLGVINGKTESTFAPGEKATRGEAAKMTATFMKVSL